MNSQQGKVVTILVLIVTMVIQPVLLSYAMAGMDHGRRYSVTKVQYQVDHHVNHARNILIADHQTNNDSGGVQDDCCYSTACSPAALLVSAVTSEITNFLFPLPLDSSAEGIHLPVKLKPPQIFPEHRA